MEHVTQFEWNDEAFEQLVIPAKHKQVLKTLVESHNAGASKKFDDFVTGKGHGLVINLFGNPGTGKSLTAEAMSECTSRFVSFCCSYAHSSHRVLPLQTCEVSSCHMERLRCLCPFCSSAGAMFSHFNRTSVCRGCSRPGHPRRSIGQ